MVLTYHTYPIPNTLLHCFNGTLSGSCFTLNTVYRSTVYSAITGIDHYGKVNRRGDTTSTGITNWPCYTVLAFLRAHLGTPHPFSAFGTVLHTFTPQ